MMRESSSSTVSDVFIRRIARGCRPSAWTRPRARRSRCRRRRGALGRTAVDTMRRGARQPRPECRPGPAGLPTARASRRALLLGPGVAMAHHRHVLFPADDEQNTGWPRPVVAGGSRCIRRTRHRTRARACRLPQRFPGRGGSCLRSFIVRLLLSAGRRAQAARSPVRQVRRFTEADTRWALRTRRSRRRTRAAPPGTVRAAHHLERAWSSIVSPVLRSTDRFQDAAVAADAHAHGAVPFEAATLGHERVLLVAVHPGEQQLLVTDSRAGAPTAAPTISRPFRRATAATGGRRGGASETTSPGGSGAAGGRNLFTGGFFTTGLGTGITTRVGLGLGPRRVGLDDRRRRRDGPAAGAARRSSGARLRGRRCDRSFDEG